MSEMLAPETRELWLEGPNYTADAVIIDPHAAKLLLIERSDGGGWALPGGFVDQADASGYHAAVREASEETSLRIGGDAPLIFAGIVDDPRNSERSWIETEAYLFQADSAQDIKAGDDADNASWHNLANLPTLYASHGSIVNRSLDHLLNQGLMEVYSEPTSVAKITKGHMEYEKFIARRDGQAVFCKQHQAAQFYDQDRAKRSLAYLKREAIMMAHLRSQGFDAVPAHSILHDQTLVMDALIPEEGWQWKADSATIDHYITDCLEAFKQLETLPIPSDTCSAEPSYQSIVTEGWAALNSQRLDLLGQRFDRFYPRLRPSTQVSAQDLTQALPDLQRLARHGFAPDKFVFCHHDARQSNIAWHPTKGVKLVDWSWAGLGLPGSDATSLLIDLHKSGHDVSPYLDSLNPSHCVNMIGYWLGRATYPIYRGDDTVRFQQLVSAISGFELLNKL